MSESDFAAVKDLVRSTFGIHLHEGKKALVSSRLEKLVRGHGFDTYTEYVGVTSHRRESAEFTEFIDTLTTNHSGFWREPEHFEFLRDTAPENPCCIAGGASRIVDSALFEIGKRN